MSLYCLLDCIVYDQQSSIIFVFFSSVYVFLPPPSFLLPFKFSLYLISGSLNMMCLDTCVSLYVYVWGSSLLFVCLVFRVHSFLGFLIFFDLWFTIFHYFRKIFGHHLLKYFLNFSIPFFFWYVRSFDIVP